MTCSETKTRNFEIHPLKLTSVPLESLFPKKIHAVTKKDFLLKTLGFFLARHFLFFF